MTKLRFPRLPVIRSLPVVAALGAVAITIGATQQARAQNMPGSGSGMLGTPTGPVVGNGPKGPERPKDQGGAAVPGAESHGEAAPATKDASEMQPTDALFDAINRGDIAAARDALNRGADFEGRNVLGMTPTELSVDLGRNDITFLLLSMRGPGGVDDERGPPAKTAAATGHTDPRPGRAGHAPKASPAQLAGDDDDQAPARRSNGPRIANSVPVADSSATQATYRTPPPARQYAVGGGNGGTPAPQAGFLGFGGSTAR